MRKKTIREYDDKIFKRGGRWYFLNDNDTSNARGPYNTHLEALWEKVRNAHWISTDELLPSFRDVEPILQAIIEEGW